MNFAAMLSAVLDNAPPQRIRFQGRIFWLLANRAMTEGAIAPLEHCDERGHITDMDTALGCGSYAHLFSNGTVLRYGRQIGTRDDIEFLAPDVTTGVSA